MVFHQYFGALRTAIVATPLGAHGVHMCGRDTILELIDHSDLKNVLKKNLKLYVVEKNPKTTVTVTDYFFMLGLFRFDGSYDYSDELLSYNQQGMEWGRGLFNHYLKESKVFDLRD